MATLILGLFRTRHNGLFIPGKETLVTVAKTYSTKSSMPTTRIQPVVRVALAIAPNRKSLQRPIGYTLLHLSCCRVLSQEMYPKEPLELAGWAAAELLHLSLR